jgi:branched-chain amino acid aminotransferase
MAISELASVDGQITLTAEATIALKDDGLYRGDGVFEVIYLYGGKPFALGEHLDRLERSAAGLELPVERAALEREIAALLDRLGAEDALLRLIVTRGGRRIAAIEPVPEHAEAVRVATVTYSPTVILNGLKTLSYGANMQSTRMAKASGADEAVFVHPDGTVLEPPTSTIFWVSPQGALRTPALESGILRSVTRARVIDALEVEEGAWPVEDLRAASEAFLAGTTREIQPISAIDGSEMKPIPGPRTRQAQDAYAAALRAELGGD